MEKYKFGIFDRNNHTIFLSRRNHQPAFAPLLPNGFLAPFFLSTCAPKGYVEGWSGGRIQDEGSTKYTTRRVDQFRKNSEFCDILFPLNSKERAHFTPFHTSPDWRGRAP
jgi:hypothetical protein